LIETHCHRYSKQFYRKQFQRQCEQGNNGSDHPEENLTNYSVPLHAVIDRHDMGETDD